MDVVEVQAGRLQGRGVQAGWVGPPDSGYRAPKPQRPAEEGYKLAWIQSETYTPGDDPVAGSVYEMGSQYGNQRGGYSRSLIWKPAEAGTGEASPGIPATIYDPNIELIVFPRPKGHIILDANLPKIAYATLSGPLGPDGSQQGDIYAPDGTASQTGLTRLKQGATIYWKHGTGGASAGKQIPSGADITVVRFGTRWHLLSTFACLEDA